MSNHGRLLPPCSHTLLADHFPAEGLLFAMKPPCVNVKFLCSSLPLLNLSLAGTAGDCCCQMFLLLPSDSAGLFCKVLAFLRIALHALCKLSDETCFNSLPLVSVSPSSELWESSRFLSWKTFQMLRRPGSSNMITTSFVCQRGDTSCFSSSR